MNQTMSDTEKKEYEVLRPIGFSGRREVGDTLELTDAEAENIGSDYVRLFDGAATSDVEVDADAGDDAADAGDGLDDLEIKDLKALAADRDVEIPSRGRDKIIAALREAATAADAGDDNDAE